MNLKELDDFKLGDAVHFHDILNPSLFEKDSDMLRPAVRKRLLTIAEDFIDHLGVKVKVEDITLSGSNAAYSYTKHSDIDLHVMVDMSKLPDNDVYKELFHAKKTIYNDTHDITIFGYDVELYVQDSNEPVVSLGEYSVKNDKWIKLPRKRRANFDQNASQQKYNKLGHLIERALQTRDIKKLEHLVQKLKKYRKAGLDKHGEFGPENLAYKALRTQGVIQKIFDTIDELHSKQLSIPESKLEIKPDMLKSQLAKEYKVSREHIRPLGEALKVTPVKPVTQTIKTQIQPKQQVYNPELKKPTPAAIIHIKNKNLPTDEDYHPNEKPPGPEFKPTMPQGTVRVDVSDVYDWYKLGMHISDLDGLGKHDFGKGPPSTIMAFGSEPEEHKYIKNLEKTGLTTTDIDPVDPNQPKGMKRQKVDPTFNVNEESIDEVVNLDSVTTGFRDEKDFGDYYIKAEGANVTYSPGRGRNKLYVRVFDKRTNKEVAWSDFIVQTRPEDDEKYLESMYTRVKEEYRGKGLAKLMYQYANSLGNDIQPSTLQTPMGKDMWKGLSKSVKQLPKLPEPKPKSKPSWWQRMLAGKPITAEASGYIPSEKEKNDPRFKTALTVDVHPDSIKQNAKAFGFKVSRAGIPPLLRKKG